MAAQRGRHGTHACRSVQVAALLAVTVPLATCAGAHTGRFGPTLALRTGAPRNACEQERWLELARARTQAQAATPGWRYWQIYEGDGVFRPNEDVPRRLEGLWPAMQEPELQREHEARISPVDAAKQRGLIWSLVALPGMAAIASPAFAFDQGSPGAYAFALAGVTFGVVAVVMALANVPSAGDQLAADARRVLFIDGEDDPDAVTRGLSRANATTRQQCGGSSVAAQMSER
jgi:hypothetical protein